jgi:prevent-host-death family protein
MDRIRAMERRISVREASLRLSEYLDWASKGEEFVVTKRGQAIARIVPPKKKGERDADAAKRQATLRELFATMDEARPSRGKVWNGREELYGRGRRGIRTSAASKRAPW